MSENYQQGVEKRRDDLYENIPEDDHVEGLKFLAERDMRSLHKVPGFCLRIFLLKQAILYSTYLHLEGEMFRCWVFGNIFILREGGVGLGGVLQVSWTNIKWITQKCSYVVSSPNA